MHYPVNYRQVILGLWLLWLLYWFVSAAGVKRTVRSESGGSRISHWLPLTVGVYLLCSPEFPAGWMTRQILPDLPARYLCATLVVALGLAFTVWARVHLGRNWSGSVTQKEGHQLIRSGPYALVRHPIYAGLIVALTGNAIALGEPRGFLGVLVILGAWVRKLRIEEVFMRELFPGQYERYATEVPALVPFTRARRSAPR
ncbi:MAG: isoprenylcysteine carboxylmethyltransferase family protein [Proteobacteria bacterium]|nr:isoprenylcysteine carboxylmethyltransferase family protein [Pseudomonadota bacterium]